MKKNQKKYTSEFKEQIVALYRSGNYSLKALSGEYGVAKSTISGWLKELAPALESDGGSIPDKEYKALQKRMKELELENEILKKATAIFAREK